MEHTLIFEQERASAVLESLTERQRQVLDKVLEHKSNKLIARELGIAPNTVEQRIKVARDKLGTVDRSATARAYAGLKAACGESTYGFSVIDLPPETNQLLGRAEPIEPLFTLQDSGSFATWQEWPGKNRRGLEAIDFRFGIWGRAGLVVAIAALIALIFAATLAIANALDQLV